MPAVSRRGFVAASGLTLAGIAASGAGLAAIGSSDDPADPAGTAGPAGSAGPVGGCDGPAVQTFGTASRTASIVGATVHRTDRGDFAYVVTRGQTPPVLAELDLTTRELTRTVRLDRGEGAWGVVGSGDSIYAGTYAYPDLYRFDIATGEVELVETIGPDGGMVWCLATTPDGTVYAGTYPRGEVWGHDPRTGEVWNWGTAATGEPYVRALAADDDFVYAGTLTNGHVIRFGRVDGDRADGDSADGDRVDITPGEYGGAAALLARDGRVVGSFEHHLVDFAIDGSDVRAIEVPDAERLLDAITMTPDGTVYGVGRPSGTVYRRVGDRLDPVAAPVTDDEHRAIVPLDDHTLFGVAGSGRVWWLDTSTGTSDVVDLVDAGLSGPELVQSIAYGPDGVVHVGGNSAITTHRPATGRRTRVRVAGEPKRLRVVDGLVYAAMYPSTELLSVDVDSGELMSYGRIEAGQMRPHDVAFVPEADLLLVGTGPLYGALKGALTVVDRSDHAFTVYRDVLPDQSVVGIGVEAGVAYLGGDTWGGGSVDPVRPSATVAAFDLASRDVRWEVAPFDDHESLQHVAVHNGVLYGLYKRPAGTWFAMDLATRQVLRSGRIDGYGGLTVHDGQVYASVFGGSVYRIGPDLSEAKLVLDGLGSGWYDSPTLAFEPSTKHAWSTSGRDLARLRIDSSCE